MNYTLWFMNCRQAHLKRQPGLDHCWSEPRESLRKWICIKLILKWNIYMHIFLSKIITICKFYWLQSYVLVKGTVKGPTWTEFNRKRLVENLLNKKYFLGFNSKRWGKHTPPCLSLWMQLWNLGRMHAVAVWELWIPNRCQKIRKEWQLEASRNQWWVYQFYFSITPCLRSY